MYSLTRTEHLYMIFIFFIFYLDLYIKKKKIYLKTIFLYTLYPFSVPYFEVHKKKVVIFSSPAYEKCKDITDLFMPVTPNTPVSGDIKILFYHKSKINKKVCIALIIHNIYRLNGHAFSSILST